MIEAGAVGGYQKDYSRLSVEILYYTVVMNLIKHVMDQIPSWF